MEQKAFFPNCTLEWSKKLFILASANQKGLQEKVYFSFIHSKNGQKILEYTTHRNAQNTVKNASLRNCNF